MVRFATFLLLLLASAAACSWTSPAPNEQAAPRTSALRDAAPADSIRPDLGIGVLSFASWPGSRPGQVDTLIFYARPDLRSDNAGSYLIHHGDGNSYQYELQSVLAVAHENQIEFDYEVRGVPFTRVSGEWAEVLYGYGAGGEPRTGWVRLDSGKVQHHLWRDFLLQESVLLAPPPRSAFVAAPGGAPIIPAVAEDDFGIRPLRAEGPWMQVEIRTPGPCAGPEPVPVDTLWVRYLTDDGRPLISFYSRGC